MLYCFSCLPDTEESNLVHSKSRAVWKNPLFNMLRLGNLWENLSEMGRSGTEYNNERKYGNNLVKRSKAILPSISIIVEIHAKEMRRLPLIYRYIVTK